MDVVANLDSPPPIEFQHRGGLLVLAVTFPLGFFQFANGIGCWFFIRDPERVAGGLIVDTVAQHDVVERAPVGPASKAVEAAVVEIHTERATSLTSMARRLAQRH